MFVIGMSETKCLQGYNSKELKETMIYKEVSGGAIDQENTFPCSKQKIAV